MQTQVNSSQNLKKKKQERQIMHLTKIINTFQREEDKIEFTLMEYLYKDI